MNRTIKFRGKTTANGHWVYGSLIGYGDNTFAIRNYKSNPWVHPESVGQFTGLLDRNGKEVYEGDVARYEHITQDGRLEIGNPFEIRWNQNEVAFCAWDGYSFIALPPFNRLRVIGNIHDNPELLKK